MTCRNSHWTSDYLDNYGEQHCLQFLSLFQEAMSAKMFVKIKQGKKFWLRMTGEWQQSTPSYWERGQASFSKESMRIYINLLSSDSTPTDKPKTSRGLQTTNYIIFPTSDVKSKISWSLRLACYALAPSVFSRMTLSGILKILTIIYLFIF